MFKVCIIWLLCIGLSATTFSRRRIGGFGGCPMPSNQKGLCLALKDCPILNALATKRRITKADRLFLKRSSCGYLGRSPLVCCPNSENITSRFNGSPLQTEDLPSECGRIQLNQSVQSDYIVGGTEARIFDSPWLALLQYQKSNGYGFHCGGVLINKDYVLTAAHCVSEDLLGRYNMKLVSVRLGEWDLRQSIDCQFRVCSDAAQDIPAKQIILHENYDADSLSHEHDIAIILLNKSVTTTIWIRPICLPFKGHLRDKSFDNVPMDVAGWGYTSSKQSAKSSNRKMQVTLTGVSKKNCDKMYRRFNLSMRNGQMCAGGEEGFDSCRGDSRSPLMWYDSNGDPSRWYVVGIVSFGLSQCAQADFAGVYTRFVFHCSALFNNSISIGCLKK